MQREIADRDDGRLVVGRQGSVAPGLPKLACNRHTTFAFRLTPDLDYLANHALRAGQRTPPPASARADQRNDHMLEDLEQDDEGDHGDEHFGSHGWWILRPDRCLPSEGVCQVGMMGVGGGGPGDLTRGPARVSW